MHGAMIIAANEREYTELHKGYGLDEYHWKLLTQDEYWTPEQARQMRNILAAVVEVSMTIAGMPAIPLPGQYVAAVIATVVSPVNRMLACTKAPDTFDAVDASGIMTSHEVKDMSVQQMMALVLAYSGGFTGEPGAQRLPKDLEDSVRKTNEHVKKKAQVK